MKGYRIAVGLLLAALGGSLWWNAQIRAELDLVRSELVEVRKQSRWKDAMIARLSLPNAQQRVAAAGKPKAVEPEPAARDEGEGDEGEKADPEESDGQSGIDMNMVWGPFHPIAVPKAEGRMTLGELRAIQNLPPVNPEKYLVRARLLNSKGEEISAADVRSGQRSKMEIIKEFPYPVAFDAPQIPQATTDPFTGGEIDPSQLPNSSTPKTFAFRNTGWTIDLEMNAHGGLLQVNGLAQNKGMESFTSQPGETGKPIYDDNGTLLTDNKQLQPSFTTRETPFIIDMLPGKTYRLPVSAGDEGSLLEFTPVPAE